MPPKTGGSKTAAAADSMADCVFPSDIMLCILTRLPVKSLLRFKSVCKPWRKLFASPNFIKFHHSHFSNHLQNHNFMIHSVSKRGSDIHTMSLFRIESDEEKSTKLDHPYPQYFLDMDFVGSCNGLICMAMPPYGQWIELWNPALKLSKHLELPKVKFGVGDEEPVSIGFGYDEEAADFKVVRIGCLDSGEEFGAWVEVYSANSDSWETIETDLKFRIWSTKCDAIVGGNPHWIVKVDKNVSDKSHIVWFDVKKMALKMVASSNLELARDGRLLRLMEWNGCLAVIGCSETKEMVGFGCVHVLVFDKDRKIWNLKRIFGPIEMNEMMMYRPLQCSKNGKIIGKGCLDQKLFVLDPDTERVKGFEVENAQMLSFKIHEYNESLVALDGMKAVEVLKVEEEEEDIDDDDDDDVDIADFFKSFFFAA